MPPDQNQVLISAFRKKRPELSAMDDATVLQIVQKNRPELFSQPVKPIPNTNEVQAIEQLGSSIKRRVNLSEPKYYFSASAEPSPEPVGQDQGFFTGLQDAWGKTMERIEFLKANPEKAQQIKGQAT